MENQHFIKKKNSWLKEVRDKCHNYAKETDIDFYVFQTPVEKYNPDLLIIGINPGGAGKYSDWIKRHKNEGHTKRTIESLGYDENILIKKPYWEIGKGADRMRSAFSRVFTEGNGLSSTLENTVMMNMIYFNTKTEKDLSLIPVGMRNFCIGKTLEF